MFIVVFHKRKKLVLQILMNILWDMEDVVQLLLLIIEIFIQIQVRIEFCKYKAVSAITARLGSSVTYLEIWRCEKISLIRYRISRGRRDCFPLEMYHLLQRCASPALTSRSSVGDAASPAGDVVASPNCGICDTAGDQGCRGSRFQRTETHFQIHFSRCF